MAAPAKNPTAEGHEAAPLVRLVHQVERQRADQHPAVEGHHRRDDAVRNMREIARRAKDQARLHCKANPDRPVRCSGAPGTLLGPTVYRASVARLVCQPHARNCRPAYSAGPLYIARNASACFPSYLLLHAARDGRQARALLHSTMFCDFFHRQYFRFCLRQLLGLYGSCFFQ